MCRWRDRCNSRMIKGNKKSKEGRRKGKRKKEKGKKRRQAYMLLFSVPFALGLCSLKQTQKTRRGKWKKNMQMQTGLAGMPWTRFHFTLLDVLLFRRVGVTVMAEKKENGGCLFLAGRKKKIEKISAGAHTLRCSGTQAPGEDRGTKDKKVKKWQGVDLRQAKGVEQQS